MTLFYYNYDDASVGITKLKAYPDAASAWNDTENAWQDANDVRAYLGAGTPAGYLAPDPVGGVKGRLRFDNGYGNISDVDLAPACTLFNDPLAYGGSADFPTGTTPRLRPWLRTVGGMPRSGLRFDGWGVALDVDWSTLFINSSGQLTTVPATPPAAGSTSDPSTATASPEQVSLSFAARSGLIDTLTAQFPQVFYRGSNRPNPQAHGALAVNPDWTTVVVACQNPDTSAPFSPANCISILPPPALGRRIVLQSSRETYYIVQNTNVHHNFPQDAETVWPTNGQFTVLYSGRYALTLYAHCIFVGGNNDWGAAAAATIRCRADGALLASATGTMTCNDEPTVNSLYTAAGTTLSTATEVDLTAGQVLTATFDWTTAATNPDRVMSISDNGCILQGVA